MGRSRINRGPARRQQLRERAQERVTYRAGLSNAQQIERLNERFGEGEGAERERARLEREMEVESKKRTKSTTSGPTRSGEKRSKRDRRRGAKKSE